MKKFYLIYSSNVKVVLVKFNRKQTKIELSFAAIDLFVYFVRSTQHIFSCSVKYSIHQHH